MAATIDHTRMKIRCPYCLEVSEIPKSTRTTETMWCKRCRKKYEFANALAYKESTLDSTPVDTSEGKDATNRDLIFLWLVLLPLCIATYAYSNKVGQKLDGIDFMFMYIMLFFAIRITVYFLQKLWWDHKIIALFGFFAYEATAVNRIIYGIAEKGMENFIFLIIAMVIGGLLFFTRYDNLGGRSSGADSSSCSSSCGGCGGGGGCGGCG